MKDKIYPAILANGVGCTILWFNENKGISLDDGGHVCKESTSKVKNITHEYLANTYGEVVSPEHAEFIVKLGKNANAEISTEYSKGSFFNFYTNSDDELHLDFFDKHLAKDSGEKQITIPLPPKQIQTATPEEEFEMKQIMKNAGDNLVLGCEQDFKVARRIINELREEANCSDELLSSRDEWPKIGDEVLTTDNNKGILIVSKPDDHNMVVVECKSHDYGKFYRVVRLSDLSKPKTPEEELFDAFWREVGLLMNQSNLNKGIFKAAFINNITKKPQ